MKFTLTSLFAVAALASSLSASAAVLSAGLDVSTAGRAIPTVREHAVQNFASTDVAVSSAGVSINAQGRMPEATGPAGSVQADSALVEVYGRK